MYNGSGGRRDSPRRPPEFVSLTVPVMPRLLPAVAALLLACAACKKTTPEAADAADAGDGKLTVGMPAPRLAADQWLRGDPVPAFEPGKAYVVEFWATWCPPCLAAMGHLDELAKKYRADGLTVVAVTTADDRGNTPEAVANFLAGRGKDLDFVFARCDKSDLERAYLVASGNMGLPATFVVDRAGAVAYIGHPGDLDDVLPKVLAGTWKGQEDVRALKAEEAELDVILEKVPRAAEAAQARAGGGGPLAAAMVGRAVERAAGETADDLDRYAARHPGRAAKPLFRLTRAQVLLQAKRLADAKTATEGVLDEAARQRNANLLQTVVRLWTDLRLNPERKYPEIPVRAADELLKSEGEGSATALWTAAGAYRFAGDKAKAEAYGLKAVALIPDPRQRKAMEETIRGPE